MKTNAVRGRNFVWSKSIFINLELLIDTYYARRDTLFSVGEIDSSRKVKHVQIH